MLREIAGQCGLSEADIVPTTDGLRRGADAARIWSVMDLIPVKPLGEDETGINNLYQTKLPALYAKIKP